jgi:hypothetical protein
LNAWEYFDKHPWLAALWWACAFVVAFALTDTFIGFLRLMLNMRAKVTDNVAHAMDAVMAAQALQRSVDADSEEDEEIEADA